MVLDKACSPAVIHWRSYVFFLINMYVCTQHEHCISVRGRYAVHTYIYVRVGVSREPDLSVAQLNYMHVHTYTSYIIYPKGECLQYIWYRQITILYAQSQALSFRQSQESASACLELISCLVSCVSVVYLTRLGLPDTYIQTNIYLQLVGPDLQPLNLHTWPATYACTYIPTYMCTDHDDRAHCALCTVYVYRDPVYVFQHVTVGLSILLGLNYFSADGETSFYVSLFQIQICDWITGTR